MHKLWIRHSIAFLTFSFILAACSADKYIPKGKYLLTENEIQAESKEFPNKEYQSFVRQKPNKKIFGFWRFHMGLYNLSNPDKTNGWNEWLRKIGEAPVVYDSYLAGKSADQMGSFLFNKGFHEARISDTLEVRGFRAKSVFKVHPGEPYTLRSVQWLESELVTDQRIPALLKEPAPPVSIQPGKRFDFDQLHEERKALTRRLKELGYYEFAREYVYFEADTFASEKQVDLRLGIVPFPDSSGGLKGMHRRFRIHEVRVVGDYDPLKYMDNPAAYFAASDTIDYQGVDFIYHQKLPVKKNLLYTSLYLNEGDIFTQTAVDQTNSKLNALKNFRTVNFSFVPLDTLPPDSINLLDCQIELSPMISQSYDISLEGTHSSGNLGMAGNLIYNHRNLFRGAENFELKFRGAIEFLTNAKSDINQMIEFGVQTRLDVPQFWLPVKLEILQQRYSPRTSLKVDYNYQLRPEITRTIASAGFGYQWKSSRFYNHRINLIDLNYVNVTDMSDRFRELITGTYLEDSYKSHVIPALNYSMVFSNQRIDVPVNFFFVSFRPEIAGNVFTLFNQSIGIQKPEGGYLFFDTPYSQYVMADLDIRFHQVLNEENRFVYRVFGGFGVPYGNVGVMPFEKRYYSGGSNGIRAWQVRSLGPGSYVLPADQADQYPNQLGDIKLEANFEYRFDLFWYLKGAVFMDAGNIWNIQYNEDLPGAEFAWNRFYREMALGTGLGLRLDLSFLVGRLDLGMKLRDPGQLGGPGWIPFTRPLQLSDFMLNFAIGYPF